MRDSPRGCEESDTTDKHTGVQAKADIWQVSDQYLKNYNGGFSKPFSHILYRLYSILLFSHISFVFHPQNSVSVVKQLTSLRRWKSYRATLRPRGQGDSTQLNQTKGRTVLESTRL